MTMATAKQRAIRVLIGSQGDVLTAGHLGKQAVGVVPGAFGNLLFGELQLLPLEVSQHLATGSLQSPTTTRSISIDGFCVPSPSFTQHAALSYAMGFLSIFLFADHLCSVPPASTVRRLEIINIQNKYFIRTREH